MFYHYRSWGQELGSRKVSLSLPVIHYWSLQGGTFIVVRFVNCYVVFHFLKFSFNNYVSLRYIQRCHLWDSLQQQIHFNGNIFGNKCCRCNEGSLYFSVLLFHAGVSFGVHLFTYRIAILRILSICLVLILVSSNQNKLELMLHEVSIFLRTKWLKNCHATAFHPCASSRSRICYCFVVFFPLFLFYIIV